MSVAAKLSPSIAAREAALFPLPLTPLESFLFIDSGPEYTMNADMEIAMRGCLDRAAFESALAFAIARNPLFSCLIARQDDGQLAWIPTDSRPPVRWLAWHEPLDESYEQFTDLTREPGLRVWIRQDEGRSRVLCKFHHACSDGIGMMGFAEDLLAGYSAAVGGCEAVEPRPLEPERLLNRGQAGVTPRSFFQRQYDSVVGLLDGARLLFHKPLPLAAGKQDHSADASANRSGFIAATLSEESTTGLRRAARDARYTTNDMLLRDLLLVLRRWQAEHDRPRGGRRLRILMPHNLRGPDDGRMPAANVLSFAFISRRWSQCNDPRKLLQSIGAETAFIKRNLYSLYFIVHLAVAQAFGFLPWLLRRRICFATVVLSNLSYPMRRFVARFPQSANGMMAGNVEIEGIVFSPPLRPLTHAAFAVMSSEKTITISLRCDPRTCSVADAQELLGRYTAQLTETGGSSQ